ncbi:ATP-dependent Clp protease adapter ClpS [Desulfococcaceae bacterium HSG9]|nr:ATP-dependent Clp protease adapter ClpS [Desulfococcaceae bacterium HSG9]
MGDSGTNIEDDVITKSRDKTREPSMYKVLLHNDDYTTMEFVVEILKFVFHKNEDRAMTIMLNVHKKGVGVCGVYTYDIASTKINSVHTLARERGYPLRCSMEEE